MSDIGLEIHHLDVRGGDATAIIVKDLAQETAQGGKILYRMLIDAGAEGKGSAALKHYLTTYLPGEFDCIVAKLKQLVENVSATLANLIPEGLGLVVKDAVFAFAKTGQDERKDLKPALRGLGIDYRNDFVEIGGSFSVIPAKDPNSEPEYSGAVTLKARGLTISAVGKYTTIDQHPSLVFAYNPSHREIVIDTDKLRRNQHSRNCEEGVDGVPIPIPTPNLHSRGVRCL